MSALSYLNPKRVAALEIAKDMIKHWDEESGIKTRLGALKKKDSGLYKLVVEELDKYGYLVPVDS